MPAEIDAILKSSIFSSIGQTLAVFQKYAFAQFGTTGGTALTALLMVLALAAAVRILRFLFDLFRYVLLPSAAVSGLLVLVTPLSFLFVFPISAAIFSVLLLLKS
jgi:hypothetical protein